MAIQNRIKEYRTVKGSELNANPLNWRKHPQSQVDVMSAILGEIGNIDVLKVVETEDGLMLIDGHLRSDIMANEAVEVAVLDLDETEQRKVLATFDPIAMMAQRDQDIYLELAASVESENVGINDLLEAVANDNWYAIEPMPTFEPVGADEQGKLDEKAKVQCPECGHEF